MGAAIEEEEKDSKRPMTANIYEMNANRQTQVIFNKKGKRSEPQSIEMKERAASAKTVVVGGPALIQNQQ